MEHFLKYELYRYYNVGSPYRSIYRKLQPNFSKKLYKKPVNELKAIFIHIPKAAGRSAAKAVYGIENMGHYSVKDYSYCSSLKFREYFKFSFVREPLDRLYSAYSYLVNQQGTSSDAYVGRRINSEFIDFECFVMNYLDSNSIRSWYHFNPQVDFLYMNSSLSVDFLGRFENFQPDLQVVLGQLGQNAKCEHVNKAKNKKKLDVGTKVSNRVKALYIDDYRAFGY